MSKSGKKVTVGYRYFWDIHAGLGRGAVDEIVAITADKKSLLATTKGQVTKNTTLYINQPKLFGGEDTGGEGGIKGNLDILMGERDQLPTSRLINLLKTNIPAFRGLVSTVFSGLISAYSASPKPWAYRVRRTSKGWDKSIWYAEKCLILLRDDESDVDVSNEVNGRAELLPVIKKPTPPRGSQDHPVTDQQKAAYDRELAIYRAKIAEREAFKRNLEAELISNIREIHAMNPAHILIECATNRDWGRGLSVDDIDLNSFKTAADTLYDEDFGLCFRYNRQDRLDTFIQQILDHIGAAQYANLETGKLTLKLIRADYNAEELPLYTYDNGIMNIQDDDSIGIDSAPNEICVKYKNVLTNQDAEARVQNLGSIQAVGLISKSTDYKAIPTHNLATRLAQRDLEMTSAGIVKQTIVFDRRASALMPADCFRISLPERGITDMVMRVGKIDENDDGSITITAIQDVFGMPSAVYGSSNQPSEWIPPDTSVYAVSNIRLIEMPYYLLAGLMNKAELDYLDSTSGYLGILASAPSNTSINYEIQTRALGDEFISRGTGDWGSFSRLTTAIGKFTTQLKLDDVISANVSDGILIDDEIMRIDEIDEANSIITVARGCADTLPCVHDVNSVVWVINSAIESDHVEYLQGETAQVRLLTQTKDDTLSENLAPIEEHTIIARQGRPYLPARIAINGVLYPDSVITARAFILTFSYRDRILQANRLIDCLTDNIAVNSSVSYVAEINHENGGNRWRKVLTKNEVKLPYVASDSILSANHYLVVYSVQNGTESFLRYKAELPVGYYDEDAVYDE